MIKFLVIFAFIVAAAIGLSAIFGAFAPLVFFVMLALAFVKKVFK